MRILLTPALILVFAITLSSAHQQPRIGDIEYFGLTGIDIERVKTSLPFHQGDEFSLDRLPDLASRAKDSLKALGLEVTDLSPVCCDKQGNWTIYIGLPGKNLETFHYASPPTGSTKLPDYAVNLYLQAMDLLFDSIQHQAIEDRSKGYALSTYPPLRAKQLAMREYATQNFHLIRRVLREASDPQQRTVAAHLMGYAMQSKQQIALLVVATRDIDELVRNNAVRALGVLAESNRSIARNIPADGFVDMLNSGIWKDRNKAGYLLSELTIERNPHLLRLLRERTADSLLEMARWRGQGHAHSARIILGRIAGIDETRLQQLVTADDADEIIERFKNNRR